LSLFGRRNSYDRKRILDEAGQARAKGRDRRAIELYRRVLAAEPRDVDLHYRIAPLLAATGQSFDAWRSFQHVANACASAGQHEKALGVYTEAVRHLPDQFEAWTAAAELETRLGNKSRARDALIEGRHQMGGRRKRPKAIALLRAALDLEPWDVDTTLDLAALLSSSRQGNEARWLLERLTDRVKGPELVRVRAGQFRIEPTLRHAWAWLRDFVRARRAGPDTPAQAHRRQRASTGA